MTASSPPMTIAFPCTVAGIAKALVVFTVDAIVAVSMVTEATAVVEPVTAVGVTAASIISHQQQIVPETTVAATMVMAALAKSAAKEAMETADTDAVMAVAVAIAE